VAYFRALSHHLPEGRNFEPGINYRQSASVLTFVDRDRMIVDLSTSAKSLIDEMKYRALMMLSKTSQGICFV
jgi:hypothetical protein